MNGPYIIVAGNLSEGFRAHGPYDDFEDAANSSDGAEVWIMPLRSPDDAKDEL